MSLPVLVLEFNELAPELLDRFMGAGKLPNFRRLHDQSSVYVTDAQETQDKLEPWIQWVTVHTGLPSARHGVFLLGEGPKCASPRLWDILGEHGRTSWVCGSMNTGYGAGMKGMLLPDPWTAGTKAWPEGEFEPFRRFVASQVQEHTNRAARPSRRQTREFLTWMMGHGLSLDTITHIARQVLTDRMTGKYRWRRAVALDRLQWDVFSWYFRRHKPDFSTFFINSTAHFQHLYWRNMEPEKFGVRPDAAEQAEYENAVLYGYQQMDRVVGKALALAGDTHSIVFSSALGQQPCLKYEDIGGKNFYRPRDFRKFVEWVGIDAPHELQPVMSEEFRLVFRTEEDAAEAAARLGTIHIGGERGMSVRRNGLDVKTGCRIFQRVSADTPLGMPGRASGRFDDLFYRADGLKSGMHHSEGCLWIRDPLSPRHHRQAQRVPLTAVAPTLLALMGVDPPDWMDRPIRGAVYDDRRAASRPVAEPLVPELVDDVARDIARTLMARP